MSGEVDPKSVSLWQKAYESLRQKDKDLIAPDCVTKPQDLIPEVELRIAQSKGKPIKWNGENVFVRDVLQKVSKWIKKFVEVGDAAVQYDPGHAAIPWALMRLVLQMSMNNIEKHVAVLEGIEKISYYLLWSKIQEKSLVVRFEGSDRLEFEFVQLYTAILTFTARSLRFLSNKPQRIAQAFLSSGSKLQSDLNLMAAKKGTIEDLVLQISYAEIFQIREQLAEIEKPLVRIEELIDKMSVTENEKILDWISEIPYEKHFQMAHDKALKDTGRWLFEDRQFVDWRNSSRSQILWLHGGAGSGKSTLISMVLKSFIDDHETYQAPYPMFFFCSRSTAEPERADPGEILRSLVRQVSGLPGGPPLHPALEARFKKRRAAGHVSDEEAVSILLDTVEKRPITYIVVDALDECDPQKRAVLLDALEDIIEKSQSLVKVFVTSRDSHADIVTAMGGRPALSVDASRNQDDIKRFVEHSVRNAVQKRKLLPTEKISDDLRDKIEESLCKGAAGMFRWVELQLNFLFTLRKRSILLARLDKLPPGLEEIYRDLFEFNMQQLGEEQSQVVKWILSWLLVARRPLTTSELCHLVCALDESEVYAPEELGMSIETVLDLCFDFVRLDQGQDQFRFSHLSVREFLEKRQSDFTPASLHSMATCACLSLMTKQDSAAPVGYADTYWPLHAGTATREGGASNIQPLLDAFLRSGDLSKWNEKMLRHQSGKQRFELSENEQTIAQVLLEPANPFLLTACFGLTRHLQRIVASMTCSDDLELRNQANEGALYLASEHDCGEEVQILLDKGADVNMQGGLYGTALQAASFRGYSETVKLLLDKGAEVNAQGGYYGTALQAASSNGYIETVKLLLDKGADVNAQGGSYGTALQAASSGGYSETVKLLLDKGADINVQGGSYGTALQAASSNGYIETVKLLLDKGAEINAQGGYYGTALQAVSHQGHSEIVKLLLDKGAEINTQGGHYGTALQAASFGGYSEIVQLLLDAGAEDLGFPEMSGISSDNSDVDENSDVDANSDV